MQKNTLSEKFVLTGTVNKVSHLNVGSGTDIKISEIAKIIKDVVNFEGSIEYDLSKPDGTPRKLLDNTRLNSLGWKPEYDLKAGITKTYEWALNSDIFLCSRLCVICSK